VTEARTPSPSPGGGIVVVPVTGVGEVVAGADLAGLLTEALAASGVGLRAGDCLVVSSKVVSKALGLTWAGTREDAVAASTVRVVAERRGSEGVTRVVQSVAGPVMAAAGVDASNTGPSGQLLVLPEDPDAEAARLRADLLDRLGLPSGTALAVVLSDTAGRPWRDGLTDLALGSAGLTVLEDLRGATDHDGRPLAVTMRALADEVAAAADLVKGKADGIPAALVRGLDAAWFSSDAPGAGALVRVGPGDWFALGHVEAVREALGLVAGSVDSEQVGIRSVLPHEPLAVRVGRVIALALFDVPEGGADVGVDEGSGTAQVALSAPDDYDLGRLVVRVEVAAASEALTARLVQRSSTGVTLALG
jgi:coenzyme F420-0:L-glutamate ligase/coenzyme F420-1:gamma-L-glutamate ligase